MLMIIKINVLFLFNYVNSPLTISNKFLIVKDKDIFNKTIN